MPKVYFGSAPFQQYQVVRRDFCHTWMATYRFVADLWSDIFYIPAFKTWSLSCKVWVFQTRGQRHGTTYMLHFRIHLCLLLFEGPRWLSWSSCMKFNVIALAELKAHAFLTDEKTSNQSSHSSDIMSISDAYSNLNCTPPCFCNLEKWHILWISERKILQLTTVLVMFIGRTSA